MVESSTIIDLFCSSDINGMFHYEGSLTTPGCNEIVQWIVMDKPLLIRKNGLVSCHNPVTEIRSKVSWGNKRYNQEILIAAYSLKEEWGYQWGCSPRQLQAHAAPEQQDCILLFGLRWCSPNRLHKCQWQQLRDSGERKRLHASVRCRQRRLHKRKHQRFRSWSSWISHSPDWQHWWLVFI